MSEDNITTNNIGTLIRAPVLNHTSFFNAGKEVLRMTATGITVNPDVSVDEAAAAVIAVLDAHIKHLAKRPWVGLTDAEYQAILKQHEGAGLLAFYNLVEAKLRSKNEGRN